MALAYRQPGVTIDEVVTPQISSLLAAPALVCLVGPARGYQTRTDQFVLNGTSAIPLPGLPVGATLSTVTAVKDALDPSKGATDGSGYVVTTDYTVQTGGGTITRVGAGAIADGRVVNVTYTYVAADYFEPIRLYDIGAIESRFGPALNTAGTAIDSPITYAAAIALENGAGSVVCQPLFVRATPGDPTTAASTPNSTQAAATSTWADTLYVLRDIEDINVMVPIIGQSTTNVGDATQLSVFQAFQDHAQFLAQNDQYVVNIFGEDSTADATEATRTTIQTHATTLRSRYGGAQAEQTVLLSPARYTRALPGTATPITIGGQYAAAGVAGVLASQPVSTSLTRKVLSGFLRVTDARDQNERNADAAAGLCVVENKNGAVIVRHGITLSQVSAATREISVVRAKHRMIESVRDTLDRQIVGQIVADGNAPFIVASTVTGVLERLRQERDLVDYTPPSARILSLDPTTIQVRFSYRPAFPLNYVDVVFSLDLTAGGVTATEETIGTL